MFFATLPVEEFTQAPKHGLFAQSIAHFLNHFQLIANFVCFDLDQIECVDQGFAFSDNVILVKGFSEAFQALLNS